MAKDKKEKAKELARLFGKKVQRSEVKAAEKAGYSAKAIRAAIDRVGNVGDKASNYMDRQGEANAEAEGPKKVQYANLPGTQGQRVVLDKDGRYLANGKSIGYLEGTKDGRGILYSGKYRVAGNNSADAVNDYLKKSGYRLTPGKNPEKWGIVDNKQITVTREYTDLPWMGMGGGSGASAGATHYLPQGKEYVAIYGKIGGKKGGKKDGKKGDNKAPATSTAAPGSSGNAIIERGQQAEDELYGRAPEGVRPQLLEDYDGTPGSGIPSVADFANGLDRYNQRQIGAMMDIADAKRYESGSILNRWVRGLPDAPDFDSTQELIDTLNSSIKQIKI